MRFLFLAVVLFALSVFAQDLPEQAVLRRKVVAADGVALALYRYVPNGGGALSPAVLLVPDVGYGREAYDFQDRGLARFLQARGRDTFVVELRGQGQAGAPDFSLKDWAEKDLPAALKAIQSVHPGPVDLVLQGFGGSVVLAAVPQELRGKVNRIAALSTPVLPEVPNEFVRALLKSGGKFSAVRSDERAFDVIFAHGGIFPHGVANEFRSSALGDLSPRAASELLQWMESGLLSFSDGSTFAARIRKLDRPTLLLLPIGDSFSHPEFASPLRELCSAPVRVLGLTRFNLQAEDYTHLSVLHGASAEHDVFIPLLAFFDHVDAPLTAEDTK